MTASQLTIEEALAERDAILNLIALDPMKSPTMREVAAAINRVASPGDRVSANSIRPHLPPWVNRSAIGPTFGALARFGALRKVETITSTDRGTHGKDIGVWVVTREAVTS